MLTGRTRTVLLVAAFAAPVVLAGIFGFGVGKIESAAASPELSPQAVTLVAPGPGTEVRQGQPVSVRAVANGPVGLATVELWVDGGVVDSFAAPTEAGLAPFSVEFSWLPLEPGPHMVTARAIAVDGVASNSITAAVFVTDSGFAIETVAPVASGGGPGPAPSPIEIANLPPPPIPTQGSPPPGGSPSGSEPFSPGIGDLIPWIFGSAAPPSTPGMVASAAGCTVLLSVEDLSDDELGFRVYRTDFGETDPGNPQFVIGSQDGGWFELQDTVQAGSIHTYTVEAFNSFGASGPSAPVVVSTISSGCAPPQPDEFPVYVVPAVLDSDDPVEDPYCYVSPLGDDWARLSAVGFFDSDENGAILSTAELLKAVGPVSFGDELPTSEPFPGKWDCWGWDAGVLVQVGTFDTGELPVEFGVFPTDPTSGGSGLQLAFGVIEPAPEIDLSGLSPIAAVFDPVVREPSMLAPVGAFSSDTADCVTRLGGQFTFEEAVAVCHPFGGLESPQPYVLWDLSDPDNCEAGTGCLHPSEFAFFPHSVVDSGYRIYDLTESETVPVKTLSGFHNDLYIPPSLQHCGVHRSYVVRSFVQTDAPMTHESRSFKSVVAFNNPCPPDLPVQIDVELETLGWGDVDDGNDDDLEVYGGFYAVPESGTGEYAYAGRSYFLYNCPHKDMLLPDASLSLTVREVWNGCPISIPADAGFQPLSFWYLRVAGYGQSTSEVPLENHNNRLRVTTEHGSNALHVWIDLWDYDSASADDEACRAGMWITKQPDESWDVIDGEEWHLYQADNGSASCTLTFTTHVP